MIKDIRKTVRYKVANAKVSKGIALLNKHFGKGKWEKKVKLNVLKMSSDRQCIIGQLFYDGFFKGIEELEISEKESVKYGFQSNENTKSFMKVNHILSQKHFDLLHLVWVDRLTKLTKKK